MAEKKFQGGPFSGAASASQIEGWIKLNQILSAQLKEVKARSAFLTGVQKTWIATYLHGATGDEPYTGRIGESNNYGVIMCPRWRDVLKAIEDPEQELSQDFDARALLEWADGKRLTLTAAGLAAWERLNTTKQANTQEAKAADTGLAAAIGADGWADIRLVVRADGVTFHGPGGWRALPWNTVGLGEEKAAAQTAFLILLAKAGGCLPHSERVESKPDTSGNRATWTEKDWKQEAERALIRKYSERAAGENQQTKVRANVRRLNGKFMALFPSIQGRPFENKKGSTISNFKLIEFQ